MARLTLLLGALALAGCQTPPGRAVWPSPEGGVFASSQVKPPPPARPALEPLPPSEPRRAAQRAYFAALAAGQAGEKAARLPRAGEVLGAGVRDLRAGALLHQVLRLTEGQEVTVETRRLSEGGDTVLHLWWREGGREVARDDDGGAEPGASRLRFRAEEPGTYLALVRPWASEDDGRCDLLVDGERVAEQARFGGSLVAVSAPCSLEAVLLADGQAALAGQAVEPWPPAGRAATDLLLARLDPTSGALLALDDDGGVELGARLEAGPSSRSDPQGREEGAPALALLAAYGPAEEGAGRLVVNDAALGDSDGDGLGDGLEDALCTCALSGERTRCGFDCSGAASPADSDGDGLTDAEELLGRDHPRFPQLLPRWGAEPRHKDLFVELDLAEWVDRAVSPPLAHFGRSLSTDDAHAAARAFARLTGMENPDGQEGLRLHLDLGHACGPRGIDEVCGDLCAVGADGVRRCGQSRYPGPPAERLAGRAEGREHLFHLAVADCLVSGEAPGEPADELEYDCDRFTALVHELGHNLGLSHHYGTFTTGGGNCKPNYPSLMNYAYSDQFEGGRELVFSTGALAGVGDLDPRQLDETARYGGEGADVSWLGARPFYFPLHDCLAPGRGCRVDWNRDGQLDPSVRAHLSPMPGYGFVCEGEHGNALGSENLPAIAASAGPAAAELQRRRPDGTLAPALHALVPVAAPGGSELRVAATFQASGGWGAWQAIPGPLLRPDAQPAAAVASDGASERLWVAACRAGAQPILVASLDEEGSLSALSPLPGQPPALRARDVSLAARAGELLLLVRDDAEAGGDRVYLARRAAAGAWSSLEPVTAEGGPLRSRVTPALAFASDGRLYVATADPDPPFGSGPPGRLHLYSAPAEQPAALRDEELEGLRFEDGAPGHQHEAWSRPALVYVPHRGGDGQPLASGRGALHLWWIRGTRTRYLWSWGRLDASEARFSLGRWHHYEAYGYTDAIAGSGPALALRRSGHLAALLAQSDLEPGKVRHLPYADGVPDEPLVLRDHDDRPPIRAGLCAGLNRGCPERCARPSLPCGASGGAALKQVRCELPRRELEPAEAAQ